MVAGSALLAFESIEAMDAELARLSRSGGALRLGLGVGLEALAQQGGHHELGFSSLEAYALERCERSARWVQESRGLARKLEELPAMRSALLSGRLSWSMASVLASEATAQDESAWLERAKSRTVREMRVLVKERRRQKGREQGDDAEQGQSAVLTEEQSAPLAEQQGVSVAEEQSAPVAEQQGAPAAADASGADDEFCVLTVTVDREDAWLFEAIRMIVRQVSGSITDDDVLEALLAEGFSTFSRWLPKDAITEPEEDGANAAQRAWEAQLAQWREQAEVMCEERLRERGLQGSGEGSEPVRIDLRFDGSAGQVDGQLRQLASELATRDVAIGSLAERFWKANGWRRLGYATDSQYARERLGMSLSAVDAKRGLARKLDHLPRLAQALADRSSAMRRRGWLLRLLRRKPWPSGSSMPRSGRCVISGTRWMPRGSSRGSRRSEPLTRRARSS